MHKTKIYNKMEYLQRKYAYNRYPHQKSPKPLCLFPIPTSHPFLPVLFTLWAVVLKVWSLDKLHQHPLGTVWKCRVSGPCQNLLKQNLCFLSPPGDSEVQKSLRGTALQINNHPSWDCGNSQLISNQSPNLVISISFTWCTWGLIGKCLTKNNLGVIGDGGNQWSMFSLVHPK